MAKGGLALPLILFGGAALAFTLSRPGDTEPPKPPTAQPLDTSFEGKLKTLHPAIRDAVRKFVSFLAKNGVIIRITSTLRTFAEQQELYNKGRNPDGSFIKPIYDKKTGKIIGGEGVVTYAKPGYSLHNYGLAFDIVPVVNGKATYSTTPAMLELWKLIGEAGEQFGFVWGGNKNFRGGFDMPHFQMTFGNTESKLLSLVAKGEIKDGWVKLAA